MVPATRIHALENNITLSKAYEGIEPIKLRFTLSLDQVDLTTGVT